MIKKREETREFVEILNYVMFEEYKPFINRWIILKKKKICIIHYKIIKIK